MRIIQLCGKAGVGKDTFGIELKRQLEILGYKCIHIAYADRVKDICTRYLSWNGEKDEYGRHLLQTIGTEIFRAYDEDYWVKEVASTLSVFAQNDMFDYAIITDARYLNEVNILRDYMWKELNKKNFSIGTYRIKRKNYKSRLTKEAQEHSSEIELDTLTIPEIVLSGKLENLPQEVGEFIQNWNIDTKKF